MERALSEMTSSLRFRQWWMGIVLSLALVVPLRAYAWEEEEFLAVDHLVERAFVLPAAPGDLTAQTVIGYPQTYVLQPHDTLLDVARYFDLGFNELAAAYPEIDPWLPTPRDELSIPTWLVLPHSSNHGLVVNIPEMRLYYFPRRATKEAPQVVITLPVGLGQEDWPTPRAMFRVTGKTTNPVWVIPESIKRERIKEQGWSEKVIPAGSPDNPMGKYRLDLTLPRYKIHDTNNPWAVGRLVTHGCIRLYPEDIARLFPRVRTGEPGQFLYQPIKIGVFYEKVYAEVHADIYRVLPDLWEEAQRVARHSGYAELIDQRLFAEAVQQQTGVPTDVTKLTSPDGRRESMPVWK
jgi:L,D-transpeptidase ErfK/SrfK